MRFFAMLTTISSLELITVFAGIGGWKPAVGISGLRRKVRTVRV